jgi:serine/threonine protein kinase
MNVTTSTTAHHEHVAMAGDHGRAERGFPRGVPPWRTRGESWLASTPNTWGPIVADARWLWSHRVVEIVAAQVGGEVGEVADKLLGLKSQARYLLLGTIARTRSCTVFAAVDQLLAREVALKVLHDGEEASTWRLIAEVQTMLRFEHPNVVRVHELGEHAGLPYSVMELCDTDLERWHAGVAWADVLDRLLEAGRGLAAVHAAGLVHGDIKPENILLKGGVAKLGDFGLVTTPGWSGRVGGTPGYIAPEVADGQQGVAGDVFAFGCAAWTCLTGRGPFGELPETANRSAAAWILVERAREGRIDEHDGDVPSVVLAVLRQALQADPEQRPSLDELLHQLMVLRSCGALGRWLWSLRLGPRRSAS